MKRAGNLYPLIAETDNLRLAFYKAQRGKAGKAEVMRFRENLDLELRSLREQLLSGDVRLGEYHYFTIHDPKERVICAASFRERVLHHAIMNVCEPVFERYQIFDSYACRKNKGVDVCLERARYFCRNSKWHLKLDIHKYFDSVDHRVLLGLLDRRFKDAQLLNLFSNLLDTYETAPERGLPIGNLTSQHFANLYLGSLDRKIKEVWRVAAYLRYMDDFVLFARDRQTLTALESRIREFLAEELHLELNDRIINRNAHGVPFLSYLVHGDRLRLSLKAKRRFRRKIAAANAVESQEHALPLLAFVDRADSFGFRYKLFYGVPSNGSKRVNRGGSWNSNARNCRSANRDNNDPGNRDNNLGFRLALVPAQGSDGCPVVEPDGMPVPPSGGQNKHAPCRWQEIRRLPGGDSSLPGGPPPVRRCFSVNPTSPTGLTSPAPVKTGPLLHDFV